MGTGVEMKEILGGKSQRIQGFTLIELMITVVIIGILASIAYPSYVEQVRKTRRTNAQSDLVELASFMERHYTENFTYVGAGLPFIESPKQGTPKFYDLTVAPTALAYTLTATAKGAQTADSCGDLTIINTGVGTPANCW
jgi:type IV pilus assembly protein PilE